MEASRGAGDAKQVRFRFRGKYLARKQEKEHAVMIKAMSMMLLSAVLLVSLSGCGEKGQPPLEQPKATQREHPQATQPEHPKATQPERPKAEHPEHPR